MQSPALLYWEGDPLQQVLSAMQWQGGDNLS